MSDQNGDEYNDSVGAVFQARKEYDAACAAFGADSWRAEQAKEYLDRQVAHRNVMRTRHDEAEKGQVSGMRPARNP